MIYSITQQDYRIKITGGYEADEYEGETISNNDVGRGAGD